MDIFDEFVEGATKGWVGICVYLLIIVIAAIVDYAGAPDFAIWLINLLASVWVVAYLIYFAVESYKEGYLGALKNDFSATVVMMTGSLVVDFLLLPVEMKRVGLNTQTSLTGGWGSTLCFLVAAVPVIIISAGIAAIIFGSIGYCIAVFILKRNSKEEEKPGMRSVDTNAEVASERRKSGR